jgi:ribosomal protein S18 acetylase RimI-like enzyme
VWRVVWEISSLAELRSSAANDALCEWAAGPALQPQRAWAVDGAVAVLGLRLSGRDRLAVSGSPPAVSRLVDTAFARHHREIRVLGDSGLIAALGAIQPDLVVSEEFGWLQVSGDRLAKPERMPDQPASWLPAAVEHEVADLLNAHFPASYAKPGVPGVHRWAGARDTGGDLVSVAAEAWTAPGLGFLAGVATAESARGRGYARGVCFTVLSQLCAEHGRAALMVDMGNSQAVRLYLDLGMAWRALRSARHHTAPRRQHGR